MISVHNQQSKTATQALIAVLALVVLSASTSKVSASNTKAAAMNEKTEWMSLSPNVEFQLTPQGRRHLSSSSFSNQFVDTSETMYDAYAQAWRLLGFYVDCNDNGNNKKDHRNLNNDNNKNSGCSRYLLWAGYVDLEYEGGGIGEYQFWDADNQAWDTSACEATGSERCAKMDCHEPDTHFQLLGYFKHNGPDDWMEQLFKHEGVCVFGDDAYDFMEGYREFWPQGCTNSGKMSGSDYIYYDIKPLQNGGMTVGLYTDSSCSVEYTGRAVKLSDIYPNIDDLDTFFNTWNSYWDTFKTCLPCVAFQLNGQDHDGHRFLNDGNNFDCDDEAGYQNVNQCMKFATHSDMAAASFEDLLLASTQGTILPSNAAGLHLSKSQLWKHDWLLLTIAATVFVLGLTCYVYALTLPRRRKRSSRDEPLVD